MLRAGARASGFCPRGLRDLRYQKPSPTEVLLGHSQPQRKNSKASEEPCFLLTLAPSPLCRDTAPTPAMVQPRN